MISACSGASGSPSGGGISRTRRSSTSGTPTPVFAEQRTASVASIPTMSSISSLRAQDRRLAGRFYSELAPLRDPFPWRCSSLPASGPLRPVRHPPPAARLRRPPASVTLHKRSQRARGVDKVQLIGFTIGSFIVERHALRFDGNTAFAFQSMESRTGLPFHDQTGHRKSG